MIYTICKELDFFPMEDGKTTVYHRKTKKTYTLGAKESQALLCFNGINTLQDIQVLCPYYTPEQIGQLAEAFLKLGFFKEVQPKQKFNPLKLRFRLFNPNRLIRHGSGWTSVLSKLSLIGGPVLFLLGVIVVISAWHLGAFPQPKLLAMADRLQHLSVWDILLLLLINFVSLAAHELAHAITARSYGVNVPEIGVMLYCLMPCAYTNLSGIHLLKSTGQKLAALLSGNCTNLCFAGLCLLFLPCITNPAVAVFFVMTAALNLATVLLNGVFVLKYDGYYILEILLDVPELREKALPYLHQCLQLHGRQNAEQRAKLCQTLQDSPQAAAEHFLYCTYAVFSILFIPLLVGITVFSYII